MRLALYTTRRLSIDAVIRAPLPAVRAALPTPEHLIRLNPLVVDVHRDPRDAELYHIADRLRFLGLPLRLRYRARIRRGPAGVDYEAWSGPPSTSWPASALSSAPARRWSGRTSS
jgi:hypothetical protein